MISFASDTTLRWACRAGDYVLWARFQGMFSREGEEYQIADLWELRDGNFVTITNRHQDLPEGFDLHPLEVSGSYVRWMMKRLDDGDEPQEPIDGQNIWRVFAGDKLLWVGNRRGTEHSDNGVLGLLEFRTNALIYGDRLIFPGNTLCSEALKVIRFPQKEPSFAMLVGLPSSV